MSEALDIKTRVQALRVMTRVLPGNRIEFTAPEFDEGDVLDVFIVRSDSEQKDEQSILDFLESLPPGPRLFKTPEEVDRYIQDGRNSEGEAGHETHGSSEN